MTPPTFRLLDEATVSLKKLKPDPENANQHDEANIHANFESLRSFGQVVRLVVRKRDHRVFDGHGRLEAMQRLGWKQARVQYVDGSDAECRGYAIAANEIPRLSRFDPALLVPQLQALAPIDLLPATGYTPDRLEDLVAGLQPPAPKPLQKRSKARLTVDCPHCGKTFKVGESQ